MKAYLTIFLSLSLTILTGVFLGLLDGAQQNMTKLHFEYAVDTSMNATFGEFSREMLNQYDLLFIDLSYGEAGGDIANLETHLKNYLENNFSNDSPVAGFDLALTKINISDFNLASDEGGMIMRRQAIKYMKESKIEDEFQSLHSVVPSIIEADGMVSWENNMELIENLIISQKNSDSEQQLRGSSLYELEDVDDNINDYEADILNNPAIKVYRTATMQLQKLYYSYNHYGSGLSIFPEHYFSGRNQYDRGLDENEMEGATTAISKDERYLFQTYLFRKCGYFQKEKAETLLSWQIEYIINGGSSDQQNRLAVVKKIFDWRFSDQIRLYFASAEKYQEAKEAASEMAAVKMNSELLEPIIYSFLYAWSFIDSIYDTNIIMKGGQVPLFKEKIGFTEPGFTYKQYLWLMLSKVEEIIMNHRAMDIMEMDIQQTDYNENFQIDRCLESYRAQVTATTVSGANYELVRRYGYY
jgi:hypothetical protein